MKAMQWVMSKWNECPFCQFCIFEQDCSSQHKWEAQQESDTGKGWHDRPPCFQGSIEEEAK
jgi:hypothetical protein